MNRKIFFWLAAVTIIFTFISARGQSIDMARIQFLNNAPDPAADSVDIYLNGTLFINSLRFRNATRYVEIPVGQPLLLSIAPGNSILSAQSWASFEINLAAGLSYIAVFTGVSDPSRFPANPGGESTAFHLYVTPLARENSLNPAMVDIFSFNGSPDVSGINIIYRDHATVVNNLTYGDITAYYFSVPQNGWAILDVLSAKQKDYVILTAKGGFWKLAGQTTLLFTSGFANPPANMAHKALRLCMANLNGDVIAYGNLTQSKIQLIHNAADPGLEKIDLYLNGALWQDDMDFRTATPFLIVTGNDTLDIGVAPATSKSSAEVVTSFLKFVWAGESYISLINGVQTPTTFTANPENRNIGLALYTIKGAREIANWKQHYEFTTFYGVTDGPSLKIDYEYQANDKTLLKNIGYGDFSNYLPLFPRNYEIIIETSAQPSPFHIIYKWDMTNLAGQSGALFASGFLNPATNQNGESFGLYYASPDGRVTALSPLSLTEQASSQSMRFQNSIGLPVENALYPNYPNPFNPVTTISFSLAQSEQITLRVYDVLGRQVAELANGPAEAGVHRTDFNAAELASGKYYFRLDAASFSQTRVMTLVK